MDSPRVATHADLQREAAERRFCRPVRRAHAPATAAVDALQSAAEAARTARRPDSAAKAPMIGTPSSSLSAAPPPRSPGTNLRNLRPQSGRAASAVECLEPACRPAAIATAAAAAPATAATVTTDSAAAVSTGIQSSLIVASRTGQSRELPSVAMWPAAATTRLQDMLRKVLQMPDTAIGASNPSAGANAEDGGGASAAGLPLCTTLEEAIAAAETVGRAMDILKTNMHSYAPAFGRCSALIAGMTAQLRLAQTKLVREQDQHAEQMRARAAEFDAASAEMLTEVSAALKERDIAVVKLAAVEEERESVQRRSAALEAERLAMARREEELTAQRRTQDAIFAQFTKRNQTLETEMLESERAAMEHRQRAEELTGVCQRYAQRVYSLEQEAIVAAQKRDQVVGAIAAALKAAQEDHRQISAAFQRLRALKRAVDEELSATRRDLEQTREKLVQALTEYTPRPSFRGELPDRRGGGGSGDEGDGGASEADGSETPGLQKLSAAELVAQATARFSALDGNDSDDDDGDGGAAQGRRRRKRVSTMERVRLLYRRVDESADALAATADLAAARLRAMQVSDAVTRSVRAAPFLGAEGARPPTEAGGAGCALVAPIVPPALAPAALCMTTVRAFPLAPASPLPLLLESCAAVVCRTWAATDTVRRCKDLYEVYQSHCARTVKRVEFHVAIAMQMLDTASIGAGYGGGGAAGPAGAGAPSGPPAAASNQIPLAASESAFTLLFNMNVWERNPVVATFRAIVREEVGAWVYPAQNAFIALAMQRLARLGHTEFGALRAALEDHLAGERVADGMIEGAARQLGRTYIPEAVRLPKGPAGKRATVDEAAVHVFVDPSPWSQLMHLSGSGGGDGGGGGGGGGGATAVESRRRARAQQALQSQQGQDRLAGLPPAAAVPQQCVVAAPETPFVLALRHAYLHRLLGFYGAYDAALIRAVNRDDIYGPPANVAAEGGGGGGGGSASPRGNRSAAAQQQQHPMSLGRGAGKDGGGGGGQPAPAIAAPRVAGSITEEMAAAVLRGVLRATGDEFEAPAEVARVVRDAFKLCRAQAKAEAQRLADAARSPHKGAEYAGPGAGMAAQQVFIAGWTRHFFPHQYEGYPALRVADTTAAATAGGGDGHGGSASPRSKAGRGPKSAKADQRRAQENLDASLRLTAGLGVSPGVTPMAATLSPTDAGAPSFDLDAHPPHHPPASAASKAASAAVADLTSGLAAAVPLVLFLRMYRKVPFVPPPNAGELVHVALPDF